MHKTLLYSTCPYFLVLCAQRAKTTELSPLSMLSMLMRQGNWDHWARWASFRGDSSPVPLTYYGRGPACSTNRCSLQAQSIYFDISSRSKYPALASCPRAILRPNNRTMLTNIVLQGPSRLSPNIIASVKTDIGVICCIYELAPTAIWKLKGER